MRGPFDLIGLEMGMEINSSVHDALRLVRGPLLSNEEYVRAVEVAVVEVARGAGAGRDGRDWSGALKRLLMARRNPPLALWWAFSCVECGAVLGFKGGLEEAAGLVSAVSALVHSLKSLGIGTADRDTAIAILAPVLSGIYEVTQLMSRSVGMLGQHGLSEAVEDIGKKRRKLAKRLRDLIREVLTFLVLCQKWELDAFDSLAGPPAAPQFKISFASLLAEENVEGVLPYPSAFIKFPVWSKACEVLAAGETLSSRELADVVCAEVVLLQLLVEVIDWRSRLKKQKKRFEPGIPELVGKLKHIAVHAAATAGSHGSSEALLDMLLDSRLPVGDILDAQEESVLRGVLYEAIFFWPTFRSLPKQGIALFMKKVGVARVAISMFRSKNEHSRAACIQEKLKASIVPKDFLEWLKSVENDQKPSGGCVHETSSLLGWLLRSVDDITFRMLLGNCERSEHLSGIEGITELDGEGSVFYVDRKGSGKTDMDEGQPTSDVADEAFASAARDIRESSDAAAAHLPEEQKLNGKLTSKLTSEKDLATDVDSDLDVEGDTERQQNESGSKRPRDKDFMDAILLNSSGESEDDVVEMSLRDSKRVKHGVGAKLLLPSEPTPAVLEGKGGREQKEDLQTAVLAKATDEDMTEGEFAEVHTDVESEGYLSKEVAESRGLMVESMDGTTSGLQKIGEHAKEHVTPTESGHTVEDKAVAALAVHDNENLGTETFGLTDSNGIDERAKASEGVDDLKAELGESLGQNGISVATPKIQNVRRSMQDVTEESVEVHASTPIRLPNATGIKDHGSAKLESLDPSISDASVTPSNTGKRLKKRQAETGGDLQHCYEPRVTRSGKVLGVSQSVEKNTKRK